METQVIAANLLRLRKDRGLTQEQLAEAASLSRPAFRNLEKGRAQPRAETLHRLAAALNVSLFELLASTSPLQKVRFRSLKRMKSRTQILVEVGRWLDDFAELEKLLGETSPCTLPPVVGKHAIPDLAGQVRQHFGLKPDEPVHDICGLLEAHGVKVYSLSVASDAFMGLSVAEGDGGPAVIVNTWERFPVEGWIFSAAHELGHLLLHLSAYDVECEDESQEQEQQANEFASHFLMPEAGFCQEWEETAGLPLVDRVLKVKRVFKVGWRTVLYRVSLRYKKSLRQQLWQQFNLEYQRKYQRTLLKHDEPDGISPLVYHDTFTGIEPEGLRDHDFQQDRLSRLVRRVVEQEAITLSRAAEILRLSLYEMRELSASWEKWGC
ncbi:helix-turn-helix domain-containing protein [Thiothrix nivea]|uniref:Helix-turn-helix domain protein n=1 Tax=Thiothrix nivea (strain ATCC 35100 / DSM 5205 / JP2) TaxID=870187 RepID=A0A656HDM2_THINJ|nr:helix-turn-helix transcriptional regulator [Thiothrix nivea]EIJ34507.1 helix-turn-helix domain protein [Thiothrix nivea DSM 5205]